MPRQRQTRVRQQLVCRQIARLAAVEDCLGDVAEANDAGEIGGLTPARLASAAKDMSALLHECGVEQARPDPDSWVLSSHLLDRVYLDRVLDPRVTMPLLTKPPLSLSV